MKRSNVRFAVVIIAVVSALTLFAACHQKETDSSESTETIAPAQSQPATTGTEAMTQTVDVEDGRSEAEGGALTAGSSTATTATTTAPPPPPTATNATAATTSFPPNTKTKKH